MFTKLSVLAILLVAVFLICLSTTSEASPSIDSYGSTGSNHIRGIGSYTKRYENSIEYFIQICLNNCAQCKKMYGDYFKGQACGESCLRFEGRSIPDCEDISSIAQFLNRLD